jgi:3'(2'), 5'-bisphosphate nucleotidase
VRLGGCQHRCVVVDQHGVLRVEWMARTEALPECGCFLRRLVVVRRHRVIDSFGHGGDSVFDREAMPVRVRDQQHAPTRAAQTVEKRASVIAIADQLGEVAMQLQQIDRGETRPVVETVVIERMTRVVELALDDRARPPGADAVVGGIALRQLPIPQYVVVLEIEESAVHIEQHRVDRLPADHGLAPAKHYNSGSRATRLLRKTIAAWEQQMIDATQRRDLIDALADIATAAGREIVAIYQTDFDVATKADDSPLTQADLAAHRIIRRGLTELTPDIPILSEEAELPDFATRRQWTRYWLVDPLDGTKEFVNKNGEFTVNIALIEADRATLGVVGVPARQVIYTGDVLARHAERRDRQGVRALSARKLDLTAALIVVASRSHGGERLEQFVAALRQRFVAVERTPVGSSLKLCILADGDADIYPRLGPTSEWDIAAAHAVLEASGGAVWQFNRTPLRYNTKVSLLNPDFVAVADPTYDWWQTLPTPAPP